MHQTRLCKKLPEVVYHMYQCTTKNVLYNHNLDWSAVHVVVSMMLGFCCVTFLMFWVSAVLLETCTMSYMTKRHNILLKSTDVFSVL